MANSLIPANVQIPAHLAARIGKPSALAASVAGGLGSPAVPRISIKAARFRIVDGETENILDTLTLETVIVGANPHISKVYYASQWSPDAEPMMADCFSMDGIRPDPSVANPQNDICATCPHNQWGSKINPTTGKETKACADQKRLAVVAANDPEGTIYLLQVTPAALKNLNHYQKELSMRGIPPEIVQTNISFDPDASFPLLTFSFGGFLDEQTQAAVDQLFDSDAVREITGENVVSAPVEEPAPEAVAKPGVVARSATSRHAAPAPAPAPEPEPEPEPEPAAPVRGFGAARPSMSAKPPAAGRRSAVQAAAAAAAPAPAAAAAAAPAPAAAPAAPRRAAAKPQPAAPVVREAAQGAALADEIQNWLDEEIGDDDAQ